MSGDNGYSLGKTYNNRYQTDGSGKNSYGERFKGLGDNPIHSQDWKLLWYTVQEQLNKKPPDRTDTLRILDYGCGDGRYYRFYEFLADQLLKSHPHLKLEVVGYDPSSQGIKTYAERLESKNFTADENGILRNNNLSFKLLDGGDDFSRTPEQTKELISKSVPKPQFDVVTCMFGPLDHISDQETRRQTMQLLNEYSGGKGLCITVSGHKEFNYLVPEFQAEWDDRHREYGLIDYVPGEYRNLPKEEQEKHKLPYKLYFSRGEVRDAAKAAGIDISNPHSVGVASIAPVEDVPGAWSRSRVETNKDAANVNQANMDQKSEPPVGYYYIVDPATAVRIGKNLDQINQKVAISKLGEGQGKSPTP